MTTKTMLVTDIMTEAEFANIIDCDGTYFTVAIPDAEDIAVDAMAAADDHTDAEEFGAWASGILGDMSDTFGIRYPDSAYGL